MSWIDGDLHISEYKKHVSSVSGCVYFDESFKNLEQLISVGENVYFENYRGHAPKLISVCGCAYFNGWWHSAPSLEYIGDYGCFVNWRGSVPKLRVINGNVEWRGWTGTAPRLHSVNKRKFEWAKFWKS